MIDKDGTDQRSPRQHLMQLAAGYVPSSAVWVAAQLGIPDLLGAGVQSAAELARKTETNEDALYRVLRLLCTVGIFAEPKPRHFALTPPSMLLCSDHPQSMKDLVIGGASPWHFKIQGGLMHSVRTGEPAAEHVLGKSMWDFIASEPVEFERFNRSATSMSKTTASLCSKRTTFPAAKHWSM
jgi:hypothetical protein